MKKTSVLMVTVFMLDFLFTGPVLAQSNIFGPGTGSRYDVASLSERLFNLEKRSNSLNVYMNMRGGMYHMPDEGNHGTGINLSYFRPELVGDLGNWGYRIRLNFCNEGIIESDGSSGIIDYGKIYYKSPNGLRFSFGKSPINVGTFEYDWDPLYVLHFYEFQNNMPDVVTTNATMGYQFQNHLLTVEAANSHNLPMLADSPAAQAVFTPSGHHLQYSLSWYGNMFDDILRTIWSYTLRNEAEGCNTSVIMLGTGLTLGKFDLLLDYNGAFGKADYLGLVTSDARAAGLTSPDGIVTNTRYQQWVADISYRPTERWVMFVKLGLNGSSSSDYEQLRNYRKTYECTTAVQYFLDKSQDLRLSLSYYGRSTKYKEGINLMDSNYNRIELSFVCRLKLF